MWLLLAALLCQLPAPVEAAAALEASGDDQAALSTLEAATFAHPTSELLHLEAARLLLKLGRESERVQAHLEIALALAPENPRAHYLWGVWLEERGDRAGALRAVELALELRPTFADARTRAAALALARGDELRAEYHLRALRRDHPELTVERLRLAQVLERQGRAADAEIQLKELLADQPGNLGARRRYAEFLERQGRAKEAAALLAEPSEPKRRMRPLKKSRK